MIGKIIKVVFGLGVLVAVGLFLVNWLAQARETRELSARIHEARSIQLAIEAAISEEQFGLPADIGATSARKYIYRLVPGYITSERADSFLKSFLVGNVSKTDSGDSILFRTRPHENKAQSQFAVIRLAGDAAILQSRQRAAAGKEPPRTPPYLVE